MAQKCEHNGHTSHGNGFLLGVFVGALLVFLFVTKKGRRILKELSENGWEAFENLEKMADLDGMDEEIVDSVNTSEEINSSVSQNGHASTGPVRRFFKGIKRR